MTKIKALIVLAVIALIGAVCTACGDPGKQLAEFKLASDTPTEMLYTNEIYFRDYIPREYGNEYKLYASYVYENEAGETVTVEDELQDSMVFTFEHVTEYLFKIVRNGNEKDAITHTIKCMPEAPKLILNGGTTIPVGRSYNVNRMAFYAFGAEELINAKLASVDPQYKCELINIDLISAEVFGTDITDVSFDPNGKFTFDKEGFYELTFKASNRAGEDIKTVTMTTANTLYHNPTRTGYLLEAGADGNEFDQLIFEAPENMLKPEDGTKIDVRFGNTATGKIYKATYSKYYNHYVVDNFDMELNPDASKVGERLYIKEATIGEGENAQGGGSFSTMVTTPIVVNQSNATRLFATGEEYTILTSDIDFANIPMAHEESEPVFMGVFDGRGYTISNTQNGYLDGVKQGAYLFTKTKGGVIKNFMMRNVHASGGALTGRVEGALVVQNIVCEITGTQGYSGNRVGFLGIVAEMAEYVTVKDCVVSMFPSTSALQGLVSSHAGAKTILSGFYGIGGPGTLHSPSGNNTAYPASFLSTKKLAAQEGVDYWLGNDAEVLYNQYQAGNVSEFINDRVKQLGMYVEVTEENIGLLQSATSGYFILAEDIDMTGVSYTAAQQSATPFIGTLNGNGHKILNFDASLGESQGLIGFASGATVKNLYLDIVKTGDRGGLLGQAYGGSDKTVTIMDTAVNVRQYAQRGAAIVGVVQAPVVLKNVIANVKNASAAGSAPNSYGEGVISTLEVGTHGVTVDNVLLVSEDGRLTQAVPVRADYAAMGIYNTAGEHAEYYTDYRIERGILDYDREALPNDMMKDFYDEILKDFNYTEIDSENVDLLKTMTNGYYLLTEDLDLSGSAWKGSQTDATPFVGTLNGNGHTISGVNSGATFGARESGYFLIPYAGAGATIKNITIEIAQLPRSSAALFSTISGDTVIENSVITLASADKSSVNVVANNVNAKLTVKDSIIATMGGTTAVSASIANTGTGSLVLSNAFVVDASGCEVLSGLTPVNLKGENAQITTDYKFVTDIFDLIPAQLTTDYLVDSYADVLDGFDHTTITNDNVDTLLTATEGYFVLGEDIDLSDKEWAPTATFTGTLNGKQFNITGLDTALFNALGEGAVIRTVGIKASNIGNGDSAIAKNVSGNVKIENVGLYVVSMPSNNSGAITANNAGELTLKEVLLVLEGANAENTSGVLATGTGTVNYSGTYVVTTIEDLYTGTVTGTANSFLSIDDLMIANTSGAIDLNEALFASVNNLKVIKAVTNDNVAEFLSAREGYWYLVEDIDLTGVAYTPAEEFFGTFDGEGYVIKGVTSKLFNKFGGTIRNVAIQTKDVTEGSAIIANEFANATVYNVTVDSANSATLASVASADTTLNNVVIVSNVAVKPITTINSGVKAVAQNVVTLSAEGANFDGFVKADGTTAAAEDVDFFNYDVIDNMMGAFAKNEFTLSDRLIKGLDDLKVANYLNQSNITDLLGKNEGYWYLLEDVDIANIDWNGGELNGTFDGLGHAVMNHNADPHTAFAGFFANAAKDTSITIKNLKLNASSYKGTNRGLLFGTIRGAAVTIENVVIDVNYFASVGGGIVAKHIENTTVNMKDVTINVDGGVLGGNQGLLVSYASSANAEIAMDNVVIVCGVEAINNNFCNPAVALVGKDGETAVEGEDYHLFEGAEVYASAVIAEEYVPTQFAIDAFTELGIVIALNQENIILLDDARGGYWYLTEDVDMTGITFDTTIGGVNDPKLTFSGIFNGNGYTINNFTPNTAMQFSGLFGRLENATLKNFHLNLDKLGFAAGLFGLIYNNSRVDVENVVITIDSAYGNGSNHRTPLVSVMQGNVYLKDVLIVYLEENPNIYTGLVANSVSSIPTAVLAVDGLYVVAPGKYNTADGEKANVEREVFYFSMNGTNPTGGDDKIVKYDDLKTVATKGADYFVYADLATISKDTLRTELLKAQYDALTAPSGDNA